MLPGHKPNKEFFYWANSHSCDWPNIQRTIRQYVANLIGTVPWNFKTLEQKYLQFTSHYNSAEVINEPWAIIILATVDTATDTK